MLMAVPHAMGQRDRRGRQTVGPISVHYSSGALDLCRRRLPGQEPQLYPSKEGTLSEVQARRQRATRSIQ